MKTLAIRGSNSSMDYLSDYINIAVVGSTMGMSQYSSLENFYQSLVSSGKLGATDSFLSPDIAWAAFWPRRSPQSIPIW